jgi:chemotaxis protein methyltransferase CheR
MFKAPSSFVPSTQGVLTQHHFVHFADLIRNRTGLSFGQDKYNYLCTRIVSRMKQLHLRSVGEYLKLFLLDFDGNGNEFRNLLENLVVGETYLFRDPQQFLALHHEVFPSLLQKAKSRKYGSINIWSAACATGEEIYSIAAIFKMAKERAGATNECAFLGTDISERFLKKARLGIFSATRVNRTLSQFRPVIMNHFELKNGEYAVKPELKKGVRFFKHNLFTDRFLVNQDVIFCRNCLLYFNPEDRKTLIDKFYDSLRQGGYLFVAPTDVPPQFLDRFEKKQYRDTIYYKKGA